MRFRRTGCLQQATILDIKQSHPKATPSDLGKYEKGTVDLNHLSRVRDHSSHSQDVIENEESFEPLHEAIHEVLLLHENKPCVVPSIVEASFDTDLSRPGLFGRGSYFPEHPSKADQYATVDQEWQGAKVESCSQGLKALHLLHVSDR